MNEKLRLDEAMDMIRQLKLALYYHDPAARLRVHDRAKRFLAGVSFCVVCGGEIDANVNGRECDPNGCPGRYG